MAVRYDRIRRCADVDQKREGISHNRDCVLGAGIKIDAVVVAQLRAGSENLPGNNAVIHRDINVASQGVAHGETGYFPDNVTGGGILATAVADVNHSDTSGQHGTQFKIVQSCIVNVTDIEGEGQAVIRHDRIFRSANGQL